jgi:hypothetical protein
MIHKSTLATVLLVLAIPALACSKLLPRRTLEVDSPWTTFQEAKAAFERIEPNETTRESLADLGFDPYANDNVAILTYMDVFQIFIPNDGIRIEQQDPGIQRCVEARERCTGLAIQPLREFDREYGNFWLNFFEFRTRTEVSGWAFASVIVLIDDTVVYKLDEGNPAVLKRSEQVKPLGFFQDFDVEFKVSFP